MEEASGLRTRLRATRLDLAEPEVAGSDGRHALERLTFLADASVILSDSLDPDRIVDSVASMLVPRLGDGAMVFVLDGEEIRLAATAHVSRRAEGVMRGLVDVAPPRPADEFPPGCVVRTGRACYLPAITDEMAARMFPGEEALGRFRQLRDGATLTVPMTGRGRVVGALTVLREGGCYSEDDIEFAEDVARRAGTAVHNAMLYRAEREAALLLQQSLLPAHPPALSGAEVAMEYRPGTADTEVGGDLYDVIPLPDDRIGIAIGDVMGRGLRAAAVMGQLRAALHAYALDGRGPASLLSRLALVSGSLPGLQLTTCLYAVYDPATRMIHLASAGHLPPLLLVPGAQASYVPVEPGLPLGVDSDCRYTETVLELAPGTGIMLFTDGLVESRRRSLDDGMEQLRAAMSPDPHQDPPVAPPSARALVDRAMVAMDSSTLADDDTAVLVLTTRPAPMRVLDLRLPGGAQSASQARHALAGVLAAEGLSGLRDDAVLLVGELVTNALTHARSDLRLRAGLDVDRLRVSVEDRESGIWPRRVRAGAYDESGRGLLLVESLSRDWGVETTPDGKRVWFDLVTPAGWRGH